MRPIERMLGVLCLTLAACLGCLACAEVPPGDAAELAFDAKDYPRAAQLFEAALNEAPSDAQAGLHARLGLTLSFLKGRTGDAERHLEQAVAGGDAATAAQANRYLGRLRANAGKIEDAIAAYDAAHAWLVEHGPELDLIKLQVHRAALAWQRDDFEGAWRIYADVYQRATTHEAPTLQANGLDGMAMLLGYAGEFKAADELYEQALRIYGAAGKTASAGRAIGNRALLAIADGRIDDARALADRARATGEETGMIALRLQGQLVRAMADVDDEDWASALDAAQAVVKAAPKDGLGAYFAQEARVVALQALAGGGRWARFDKEIKGFAPSSVENQSLVATLKARRALARSDVGAARAHLETAISKFEAVRDKLGVEHLGSVFTRERTQAYELLIGLLVDADDADAALRVIGSVKARTFAAALSDEAPAADARSTDAGGAGGRADAPIGLPDARVIQRVHLRFALAPAPAAADPVALRTALPPDVAVIEYYALPDRLLVFWIDAGQTQVRSVPVARAELAKTVDAMLTGVRNGGTEHVAPMATLGGWLLDPIATQINDAGAALQALVVVPHGPLHPIPFEALPWAGALLVDRTAVVSAANLTAVQSALTAPPRPQRTVLAVGDPRKNLPGARREAEEVASRFEGPALLGSAAQETAVRRAMRGADLLHFAVHGVRPDPTAAAYLELAPDSGQDGRLYADELANERIKAALVVLSVCDSARGRPNRGDEIVGVIDRAFLRAGARSVVASRWPVHDAASVLFMRHFYDGLRAGKPVLQAFHGAQLALRRKQAQPAQLGPLLAQLDGSRVRGVRLAGAALPKDFAHPYFWAAFSLRGAWR